MSSQYVRTYSRTYWERVRRREVWSGRVSVLARNWWRSGRVNTSCRSELIVRRSSSDEARWTSTTHSGVWLVVTPDNISWPTRGPNVDATIGSTMRSRGGLRAKSTCNWSHSEELVAGRRCARLGLSRRRSRVRVPSLPVNSLQICAFCRRVGYERPPVSFHPALIPHRNSRPGPAGAANPRTADDRPARRPSCSSQIQIGRISRGFCSPGDRLPRGSRVR